MMSSTPLLNTPPGRPCDVLIVEFGLNNGDSLSALLSGAPSLRLAAALLVAARASASEWSLERTCVHGFEPDPI